MEILLPDQGSLSSLKFWIAAIVLRLNQLVSNCRPGTHFKRLRISAFSNAIRGDFFLAHDGGDTEEKLERIKIQAAVGYKANSAPSGIPPHEPGFGERLG